MGVSVSWIPPERVPKARDRISIDVPGQGEHPAVVLAVEPGMMVLAVGSTTPIAEVQIVAVDRDPNLRTMRLRAGSKTIFFECHVQPAAWDGGVTKIWGHCPPSVFTKLFDAMERIADEAYAGLRTIRSIPTHAPDLVKKLIARHSAKAAAAEVAAAPPVDKTSGEVVAPVAEEDT